MPAVTTFQIFLPLIGVNKQTTAHKWRDKMSNIKNKKIFTLSTLAVLLVAILAPTFLSVTAQGTATVVVLDTVGGTVTPAGTTTYPDGTAVTLTATTMDDNFLFSYWIIAGDTSSETLFNNPATITVSGGKTYAVQAIFSVVEPPPGVPQLPDNMATAATVIVLPSAGGTTTPDQGTYALADATSMMLTATPNSGWQFAYWTISGASTDHGGAPVDLTPSDNPYNVNHGYGYTYYYQAVFTPVGSNVPTPTPIVTNPPVMGGLSMETLIIIGLVVVIVILLIALAVLAMRKK
jgi:Divergent InlB B-repeat domain